MSSTPSAESSPQTEDAPVGFRSSLWPAVLVMASAILFAFAAFVVAMLA